MWPVRLYEKVLPRLLGKRAEGRINGIDSTLRQEKIPPTAGAVAEEATAHEELQPSSSEPEGQAAAPEGDRQAAAVMEAAATGEHERNEGPAPSEANEEMSEQNQLEEEPKLLDTKADSEAETVGAEQIPEGNASVASEGPSEGEVGGVEYDPEKETRWWLPLEVGDYKLRALYDPGASCTVMGPIGLRIASSMGRKLSKSKAGQVRLADGKRTTLVGHVLLPFTVGGLTKDLRVGILPGLDEHCYVGVNFVR
jgi:hypothetical protein